MLVKAKAFDIYGIKPEFLFKGRTKHSTWCGFVASVLTLVITGVFGFLFGSDFLFRTNPIVISQESIADKSPLIYPTSETFPLFFTQTNQGLDFEELIEIGLNAYFHYFYLKKNSEGKTEKYFMMTSLPKRCSLTSAVNNPALKQVDLTNMYCLDWEDISSQYGEPVPFGGTLDESEFAVISLYLTNYTMNSKTYRLERFTKHSEIVEYFGNKQATFVTYYPSFYLDVDSIEDPLKNTFESKAFNLNPSLSLTERRIFEQSVLDDDIGWIFKDIVHYQAVRQNKFENEMNFNFGNDDSSRTVYYQQINYLGRKNTILRRRFMKIQELTAIIGGFLKVVLAVFQFIVSLFARFDMNREYFAVISKDKASKNNYLKDNSANSSNIPIKTTKKARKQISFWAYLFSFLKFKEYQSKYAYDKELRILEEKLDVTNILQLYDRIHSQEIKSKTNRDNK